MKPRAFVVMPFGQKSVTTEVSPTPVVDFDRVWNHLIKPALEFAGCEPFRADSEAGAGDIRTDMFFELVTADIVVADLSITNPNVYYELGIRDGVCKRGVFLIEGGWTATRPFDVAQDRTFKYDGKLFTIDPNLKSAVWPPKLEEDQERAARALSSIFNRAFSVEAQQTGSPVYSHLPGLEPVDWGAIDTSRARYFGTLQGDWGEKVRRSQLLNRPGHILTIAQYAPTRAHRTKILCEAARALIGVEQFEAAEEVLEEVLQVTPENYNAQLYLAVAQINAQDVLRAERQLRGMLRQHEGDAYATMALAYVYRLLWYLQWKDESNPCQRAKESPRLLLEAIRCYFKVQQLHPEQYLAGYNALLLSALAKKLFGDELRIPEAMVNQEHLAVVVRYGAEAARKVAEGTGDYETQFWAAVALSGLDMLDGRTDSAVQAIRDACSVPSASLFNLRWLTERLRFLEKLEFNLDSVQPALQTVDSALQDKQPLKHQWRRVVVFHGYPFDKPDSPTTRFPRTIKQKVQAEITSILDKWKIGAGDLALCSGATQTDIYFANNCLDRKAQVRLLILEPTAREFAEELRDPEFSEWADDRAALMNRTEEIWFHRDELGGAIDVPSLQGRHSCWLLNTARIEAESATATREPRLYGIILSDGSLDVDDLEGPAYFASEIRNSIRHQGLPKIIDLRTMHEQKELAIAALSSS